MALNDYSDEDEFYEQGFEKDGVISVWVGLTDDSQDPEGLDVLQDLCGVGYYSLDDQEGNSINFESVPAINLLEDLSYSSSYQSEVVSKVNALGLPEIKWILVQFDFSYDPKKVTRECAEDPIFVGVFNYEADDEL